MPVDVYASTELDLSKSSPSHGSAVSPYSGLSHPSRLSDAQGWLHWAERANHAADALLRHGASDWRRGLARARRLIPAQARLFRWRMVQALHQARARVGLEPRFERSSWRRTRELRRWPPVLLLLVLTGACGLVSHEGGDKNEKGTPAITRLPDLSKDKRRDAPVRPETPWAYVLPVDHGVRADRSGKGHFRAPRFHGEHNGIDLLAPVGTPVFSPCDGQAMAGASRSFGRWLHVICPVPGAYRAGAGPDPWASFFYAHLSTTALPHNEWVKVGRAEELGQVGKSGNARGPNVQPHLHLELIVQRNHRSAMDEHHLGKDQSDVAAAGMFAERLAEKCLDPFGFQPKSQLLRRARRIDPFVALTCLSPEKPDFVRAPKPLSFASSAWSEFYVAKNFNVNRGLDSATR